MLTFECGIARSDLSPEATAAAEHDHLPDIVGADARIILDAYPAYAIPAKVVFIASQAQFTPKTVETKDERDKLMFRIRVRIDPERLRDRAETVRNGLQGIGYVRTDPAIAWPQQLRGDAPS